MRTLMILAMAEFRHGVRNRWILALTLMLTVLGLSLALLGSAPGGVTRVDALSVAIANLSSLSVYLIPLMALMLSFDALVGEVERGTMLLLMSYPVARWQIVCGKLFGHVLILCLAVLIGYGITGATVAGWRGAGADGAWAFVAMMAASVLLGAVFAGLGFVASALARERSTAAGIAIGIWLVLVVVYDLALLGALVADEHHLIAPDLFVSLLVLNPTDAFRMLNLAGSEGVRLVSGLSGIGKTPDPQWLLGALGMWFAAAVVAAAMLVSRREL